MSELTYIRVPFCYGVIFMLYICLVLVCHGGQTLKIMEIMKQDFEFATKKWQLLLVLTPITLIVISSISLRGF